MDLPSLLCNSVITAELRKEITQLVSRKETVSEQTVTSRVPALDVFIDGVLREAVKRSSHADRTAEELEANALFRSIVLSD